MDLTKEFIDRIIQLSIPEVVTVDGREYATVSLTPVKLPTPTTLQVHTLTALAVYITSNRDLMRLDQTIVHVLSETGVRVLSALDGPFQQRHEYMTATPTGDPFPFGRFLSIEDFVIGLSARFQETEHREQIVKMVSSLTAGSAVSLSDDGISQQTTGRNGVSLTKEITLPRLVTLRPYRTFPEIEKQPESEFVFRVRGDEKTAPVAALFEADGGKWKLEAIKEIKKWLGGKLPDCVVILA